MRATHTLHPRRAPHPSRPSSERDELARMLAEQRRARRRGYRIRRIKWTTNTLACLALAVVALSLASATLPRLLGYQTLLVQTGSMGRAAPQGSLVVARSIPADRVQVGTIVLLERSDVPGAAPVLHRVVQRSVSGTAVTVRTKGDVNPAADPDARALPAQVPTPVRVFPRIGELVALATTRHGWFLLLVLPAAVLLGDFLVRTWTTPHPRAASV